MMTIDVDFDGSEKLGIFGRIGCFLTFTCSKIIGEDALSATCTLCVFTPAYFFIMMEETEKFPDGDNTHSSFAFNVDATGLDVEAANNFFFNRRALMLLICLNVIVFLLPSTVCQMRSELFFR